MELGRIKKDDRCFYWPGAFRGCLNQFACTGVKNYRNWPVEVKSWMFIYFSFVFLLFTEHKII